MPKKKRTPESWQKLFIKIYGYRPSPNELKQLITSYQYSVLKEIGVSIGKKEKDLV